MHSIMIGAIQRVVVVCVGGAVERVEYIVLLVVYIAWEHYNVNGLYCTVTTLLLKR